MFEYFSEKKYNRYISMNGGEYTDYLTAKEVGEKWGITARMVNCHCAAGRIPGAVKKRICGLLLPMQKNR